MGFLIQRPKVEDTFGPRLDDRKITDSAYGLGITKGFGTVRVAGNIIHGDELNEQVNVERIDTGGKGGKSPRPTNTTYSYRATFALSLGLGVVDAVLRVWFDGTLVYDVKDRTVSRPIEFTLYKGTEDQEPDPILQAIDPDVPAYRGQAYLVFEDLDVGETGNKIPNITAEIIYANVGSSTISTTEVYMEGVAYTSDFIAENSLCVDWYRDIAYMRTSAGVTIAVRLSDMTFLRSFNAGVGGLRGVSLIDGTLIYSDTGFGGENSRVDQYTGNVITTSTSNTGLNQMRGPTVSIFTIGSLGVNEIFLSRQANSGGTQLNAFDGATLDRIGDDVLIDLDNTWNHMKHVSGYPGTGVGYALFNSSSEIRIYQISLDSQVASDGTGYENSAGVTLLATLTTADIDSDWTGFGTVAVASFSEASDGINVLFDLSDGTLVSAIADSGSSGEVKAFKYDPVSDTVVWVSEDLIVGWQSEGNQVAGQDLIAGNYYGWTTALPNSTDQNFTQIDLRTGVIDDYFDGSGQGQNMGWPDQIWDGDRQATFQVRDSATRDYFARNFYGTRTSQNASVADIISYYCEQAGLVSAQYDVTAVTDTVDGFIVTDASSPADNLKDLLELLHIDAVESDGVLTFVPRADTVDWTIDQADFVRTRKDGPLYEEPREKERELPVRIEVTAKSEERDYEDSPQVAFRSTYPTTTVRSVKKEEIDIPAVLTDDDIRRLAEKRLYTQWIERDRIEFTLPKKYLGVEPTDVINITLNDGSDRNFRVEEAAVGKDLTNRIEAKRQINGQYSSTILADAGQVPLRQSRTKGISPELFVLNTPLLRDADSVDSTGFRSYWAAGYYGNLSFGGAALFKSNDAVTWEEVGVTANEVTWGVTESALGVPDSPWRWDYTNTVTVRLVTGSIASDTEANVLSGSNGAILIQSNGEVEIIQFMTVTAGSETDQYILSDLIRGRRGTDTMMSNHGIGDKIVFLTAATMRTLRLDLDRIDAATFFKGVTQGMLYEEALTKVETLNARDQMPYAPRNARAEFDSTDIDITWVRRGRVGGELIDGTDTVPLSETLEQYEIDIYDDAGTTILRTVVVDDAQTMTYTAAQQSTDSWDGSTHIKVAIYQMSGIVGRGFGEQVTLEIN